MHIIREAQLNEYPLVKDFYHSVGETVVLASSEKIIIALIEDKIIGAARLVKGGGYLVLRTVNIAPEYQKRGIGTNLLENTSELIGDKRCYCLPYSSLEKFYQIFGFRRIQAEQLPGLLFERFNEYNQSFCVIAMRKN